MSIGLPGPYSPQLLGRDQLLSLRVELQHTLPMYQRQSADRAFIVKNKIEFTATRPAEPGETEKYS